MKFKEYKKEYEDVFLSKRLTKKCDIDEVSLEDGEDVSLYINDMRLALDEYQQSLFDKLVKVHWLFRKFCYKGKRRKKSYRNGFVLDGAFGVFMRKYVGMDSKIITKSYINQRVATYFDTFFPDFDISNPFESKYEYPYEHMKIECLILVSNMPERMELLQIGEDRRMGYNQFFDYVINYINCYNEEHGETFEFIFSSLCPPYIKKYEEK